MLKKQLARFIVSFAIFLIHNSFNAQITVDDGDMPSPNGVYFLATAAMNGNDASESGQNHIWDYSDLGELNSTSDTAVSLEQVEPLFQLVFNNPLIFSEYVSDHYFGGQGFDLGGISLDDVLNFYRKTSSSYEQTGFGGVLNGQEVPVAYDPKDIIYEFPMNFGDSTNNYAFFEATIPTLGYWSEDIYRMNEVEGWGTLELPNATHEVLKVKTTLNIIDSIYVDFIMLGTLIEQPERIEYKWLAKNMGVPVLTITEIAGQVTTAQYLTATGVVSSLSEFDDIMLKVYPNPSSDELRIETSNVIENYIIYDQFGRAVLNGSLEGHMTINISNLSLGKYELVLDHNYDVSFVKY